MKGSDDSPAIPTEPVQRVEITDGRKTVNSHELTTLLALAMSLVALAIDILLPAFADIRAAFELPPNSTAAAGLITAFLLGLAVTQVVYGVLADRFGRKPMLYLGLGLYIAGALASTIAPTLEWLLIARFVWGAGAASPRILTLSILRDVYSGERMAKAMSFVMALFILVPVVAPSLGAVLTAWITWRGAVGFTVLVALLVGVWLVRLPETLHHENRIDLTYSDVMRAGTLVLTNRITMGYTLGFTALFGGFVSYLASSELILAEVFGLGEQFPLIFGGLATVMGVAVLANGSLVERVGLSRLLNTAMVGYLVAAASLALLTALTSGVPPFWLFATNLAAVLAMHSLLIPNMSTAAMIPMGPVAGTASAIIATVSTALGAVIGAAIDRAFDGTVAPLSTSFLVLGIIAWGLTRWADAALQRSQSWG